MPSREYLEKLFEAEKEATYLNAEAQTEASRRISAAKAEADTRFSHARAAKNLEVETESRLKKSEIDAESRSEIAVSRATLEKTPISYKVFSVWCEESLHGFI